MASRKSESKKARLLAAAGEVFVEKGFRDATVAEICARAGANVAAVSYHFGSKEALYQATWRHSFAESMEAYPVDGGVSEEAPAEERLRGLVTSLIGRISDERNRDFYISQMEIMNPTGLLQDVMKEELIPQREMILSVVRDLLGPRATDQQVHYCEISIASMCVHPMVMKRLMQMNQEMDGRLAIDDVGAFTDHVVRFAVAGIEAIRGEGVNRDDHV